jgi:hypothetical protein
MIVCWLYRRIISSRLDDRRSLSPWVQRHTHTCSRCLQFQHTTESIAEELQTTVASQRVQRPFLHGKIMRAVGAESAAPRPAQPISLSWKSAALVGCLLAIGTLVWMRPSPSPHVPENTTASVTTDLELTVSLPTGKQVERWTANLDEPLHRETQLVLNDAKAALNSLKKNLLPEELLSLSSTDKAQ